MADKEFATHYWFFGLLWQTTSIETVKLVARIYDNRISIGDTNSIIIKDLWPVKSLKSQ